MGAMKNKKSNSEDLKKKERHIVTWSQEEDDILREQISIHGTDNWTIIASKFKDKTTRQCRRRWYTYLNSDFKKGGWSPEEDTLLCEAQKIFGNRWTEIAKVVSGRTDNAVKNRFSTLCKKRAKYEAMAKENNSSYINLDNKRVVSHNMLQVDEVSQFALHQKKIRRTYVTDPMHNEYGLHKQSGMALDQQLRTPLAVLVQNINSLTDEQCVSNVNEAFDNAHNNKIQGAFLKKDDPKIAALMQQADLLSSLAQKVSTEKTDQSFENAWKVLQEFLNRGKGCSSSGNTSGIGFQQEGFRETIENLIETNEDSQASWRHLERCEESPASSEYSSGSAILLHTSNDRTKETQTRGGATYEYSEYGVQSLLTKSLNVTMECANGMTSGITTEPEILQTSNEQMNVNGVNPALSKEKFGSPIQLTPLFTSLAAGIPSPKFSESERSFLMKTLGMESPAHPNHIANPSHPPPCKRALLQSF